MYRVLVGLAAAIHREKVCQRPCELDTIHVFQRTSPLYQSGAFDLQFGKHFALFLPCKKKHLFT